MGTISKKEDLRREMMTNQLIGGSRLQQANQEC
jgi:hypothetical protein